MEGNHDEGTLDEEAQDMEESLLLHYARDLAALRRDGRNLRRRIEEQQAGITTLLIADDEPFMRALIAATLSPETYEIIEATNGADALALIRERTPTMVLLDQRMPSPDGITVCRTIKGDPDLRDTLVIMLTANPADEPDAVAAGADAYLGKPFSPKALLETIERLLREVAGG
jgi:CheY-like chemotaxis protein